jgi:hypothetical protein
MMDYNPLQSRLLLLWAVLFLCTLPLGGQNAFKLYYKVPGSAVELTERIDMEYAIGYDRRQTLGGADVIEPVRKAEIPVFVGSSGEKITLRINVSCPRLSSTKMKMKYVTSGAFGSREATITANLDEDGRARFRNRRYLGIPVESAGKGSIQLSVVELPGKKGISIGDQSKVELSFTVVSLDIQRRKAIKNKDVKAMAKWYDYFDFFLEDRFAQVQLATRARAGLEKLRTAVEDTHHIYKNGASRANASLNEVFDYYQEFGNLPYTSTRSYRENARAVMMQKEAQFWRDGLSKYRSDITFYDEFYDAFCDNDFGYTCQLKETIELAVRDLLEEWEEDRSDKITYLENWKALKDTKFYTILKLQKKYREVEDYCQEEDEPDPEVYCQQQQRKAEKTESLSSAKRYLARVTGKSCGEKYIEGIEKRICELSLQRAKSERNLEERKSFLDELVKEGDCEFLRKSAQSLLDELLPPRLSLRNQKEANEGNRQFYIYQVEAIGKNDVEVFQINGVQAYQDSFSNDITVTKSAIEGEKNKYLFEFKVYSYSAPEAEEFTIEFQDKYEQIAEDVITLPKQVFEVRGVQISGNLLIVEVANGRSPYWVEFNREGSSIFHRLKHAKDTIDLLQIGRTGSGTYGLKISDANGSFKQIQEEIEVPEVGTAGRRVWPYLSGPTLLLLGFLFYRNRS